MPLTWGWRFLKLLASQTYVKKSKLRHPKVVTSAHSSVRPIVTLAVIFENSFVEARRINFKVSAIQRSKVFMRKISKIALFMEEG